MSNPNLKLDTEDKRAWAEHGLSLEAAFLKQVVPTLGLNIVENPHKTSDRYAPDLLDAGRLADLKTQNTPFFTATRYGKEPGRTVTFNRKDLERYLQRYPGIRVYFYVHWTQLEYHGAPHLTVAPLHGLWRADIEQIQALIQAGLAPEHSYQKRQRDAQGNAKSSFLLSLDDLPLVALLDP